MAHQESASDFHDHEQTYRGFLTATKWFIGTTAVLLLALYFIVQP